MKTQRLDSLIRSRGYASRREVRRLVSEGRITVDSIIVNDAAMQCDLACVIEIDGEATEKREPLTLALNKPSKYICTNDEGFYPTVFSLLNSEDKNRALFAVGRLDADTEGLLVLTNDGELCDRIIRPENGIHKSYEVSFDRPLISDAAERLQKGMVLPDGVRCRPAYLEMTGERSARITVCEGKYHEVKRLIRACGAQVATLKRISIGGLELPEDIKVGDYRKLSGKEISLLCEKNVLLF